MNPFGKIKEIAPLSFNDGLARCNKLGKKLISVKKAKTFLDLGCGDGAFTMEFAKALGSPKVFAIEFVDEERKIAEKKGITCAKSDLNKEFPYPSNKFDFVLSSQNIEHMHNTWLYVNECCRVLKPGGQLIILTENLSSWMNIFSLALGWQPFSTTNINGLSIGNPMAYHKDKIKDGKFNDRFLKKYNKTYVTGTSGHIRVLSYCGLKDILDKAGFDSVKMFTKGYLPFWGWFSDMFCAVDKRHGHFLIASAIKKGLKTGSR